MLSLETDDFFVDKSIINKIVNILAEIDAPYYIRNIILNKIINSENTFKEFKTIINTSNKSTFNFTFGNNHYNRIEFAYSNIPFNSNVIDFGCGEGAYLNRIIKKADTYTCFDIDEGEIKKIKRKIYNKANDKHTSKDLADKYRAVSVFSDQEKLFEHINENIINKENVVIIFSEVMEHIELDKVGEIITNLYKLFMINPLIKLIITTPNRDFNCNYFDGEGFRHDDHKFEFTKNEFDAYFENSILTFSILFKIKQLLNQNIVELEIQLIIFTQHKV